MTIDRLTPEQWRTLRDLRLRALLTDPDSFGSTWPAERDRDEPWWRAWLAGQLWWVARDDDGTPVGMVVAVPPTGREPFVLNALWVAPEARRTGTARTLVQQVTQTAGGAGVVLTVVDGNTAARNLFTGLGFRPTGECHPRDRDPSRTNVVLALTPLMPPRPPVVPPRPAAQQTGVVHPAPADVPRDVPRVVPDLVDALRADLAGWTVDAVADLVGPVALAALGREQVLPVLRATAGRPEPHATLLRLLVLGRDVPRADVDRALPRLRTDGAQRLGLVAAAGHGPDDAVRALVDLRPYAAVDAAGTADWWVVSDLGELATGGPLRTDHVLGVGGASTMLARCTPRRPVGRVLDLGTGCGVQALHAARHAGHVVATDVSERALATARFTWALNAPPAGGPALELRHGSLLEPVAGERFDLVVSNPPFVITPRRDDVTAYEYRDGGLEGDEVVRRLAAGVGSVLADGGTAVMLGNWEHHRGEPWADRVRGWFDASPGDPLDVWVVERERQDPAEYAELWIRDGGTTSGPRYEALYAAWLDDFERRGVEAVGFGVVAVRRPRAARRAGAALRRVEEVRGPLDAPLGVHLAAVLDAHDLLAGLDDDALAAARLVVAPDVTEERHHRPGEEHPDVVLLRQGGGLGRAVRASTALAGLVGACDGDLPVGVVVAALADLLDAPADALAAQVLPEVRGLVLDGFLGVAP